MVKTYNKKTYTRNIKIYKERKGGKKIKEIAKKYNLTHQHVYQICAQANNLVLAEKKRYIPKGRILYPKELKRIRNIFACLKQRCNNPKNKNFMLYGGRGIRCEWKSFQDFYKDMAKTYSPDLSLDRINNEGNYSKKNCRWATWKQQMSNRRIVYESLRRRLKRYSV